jgi:hypothetical protein
MNSDFLEKIEVFCLAKPFNGCWCIKTIAEIPKDNLLIRKEILCRKRDYIL